MMLSLGALTSIIRLSYSLFVWLVLVVVRLDSPSLVRPLHRWFRPPLSILIYVRTGKPLVR